MSPASLVRGVGVGANRCDTGTWTTLQARKAMNVSVTGTFGGKSVPASAVAIALKVTATDTSANGGHFT